MQVVTLLKQMFENILTFRIKVIIILILVICIKYKWGQINE